MSDFAIVIEGADSMQYKYVEAYLESDALEYRRVEMRVLKGDDTGAYITNNFDGLWAGGQSIDVSLWNAAKDKYDIQRKAAQAITDINSEIANIDADLVILNGSPSAAEQGQVLINDSTHLRKIYIYIRKIARYLGES